MKQKLPWNVTGIPPEARECARAAAARDGLSVGDWLTRRIYLESQQELQETRTAPGSQPDQKKHAEETPVGRDEIMQQLCRMEGATESALRRIDETLRTLARSGDKTASSQEQARISDRSTDGEIHAALHEQAQRTSHLARRIETIERTSDSATLRKALRGLHQGVSRLAEQVAKNEINTSNRIEALAGNIDAVSRSARETGAYAGHLAKDLEKRLSALTEQIARSEDAMGGLDDRIQDMVEDHVSAFQRKMGSISERVDGAERKQSQQARSFEEALASIKEQLTAVERRNQEAYSAFRLSLENMSGRLDSATLPPDIGRKSDTPEIDDEISSSLPGMSQEFSPRDKDPSVTDAVQKFLLVARRSTHPATEDQPAAGRLTLASTRPDRTDTPRDKGGTALRRALPVISVGLLLATGVVYLIVSGGLLPFGAGAGSARADTPPATVSDAANAAALAPAAELFSLRPGRERREERIPANDLADTGSANFDPRLLKTGAGPTADANHEDRRSQTTAEQAEPAAQHEIGSNAEPGPEFPADPAQATLWYEQAARLGHRSAMHNLAVAYANGIGIEKNLAEATRWFRSAADLGLTDSQFNLAVLYERGMGVPISLDEAYKWYFIAAIQGDTEAQSRAELLATELPREQRLEVERAATNYVPRPLKRLANEVPTLARLQ